MRNTFPGVAISYINRRMAFYELLLPSRITPSRWEEEVELDAILAKLLCSGRYDELLDDEQVQRWPSILRALANELLSSSRLDQPHRWQDPEGDIAEELFRRFGFWPAGVAAVDPNFAKTELFVRAGNVMGELGWHKDFSSYFSGTELCGIKSDSARMTIRFNWAMRRLHAVVNAWVGDVGGSYQNFLFTLTTDGDLMAIDGLLPDSVQLSAAEWHALRDMMVAHRTVKLIKLTAMYQKDMREQH